MEWGAKGVATEKTSHPFCTILPRVDSGIFAIRGDGKHFVQPYRRC